MSELPAASSVAGLSAADPTRAAPASAHVGTVEQSGAEQEQSGAGQPGGEKPSSAEYFQQIAERLGAATTPEAVYQGVIQGAMSALGARGGVVLTQAVGQSDLRTLLTFGELVGQPDVYAGTLLAETPVGDVLGAPQEKFSELYFEDSEALETAYPEFDWQGRLPPVACAFLVVRVPGEPVAVLVLEFREPHVFTAQERRLLRQLASQCALTLSHLRDGEQLQGLVEQRTRELNVLTLLGTVLQQATEPEQAARLALERLGPALGVQGMALLRPHRLAETIQTSAAGGQLPAAGRPVPPIVWGHFPGPLLGQLQAFGWPLTGPPAAELSAVELLPAELSGVGLQAVPMFSPTQALMGMLIAWNPPIQAHADRPAASAQAGAASRSAGQAEAVGTVFTPQQRWLTERAAPILALALERAEVTERLAVQHAELGARTRALEAFAELSRDLTSTDSSRLIHRAQEVVMSLLPEGYAAYYQPEGPLWRLHAQTGDRRDPALQVTAEAGLPFESTASLYIPWTTGKAYYREEYDQRSDHLEAFAQRRGGLAAVSVQVRGKPFGVFGVALFGQRVWSAMDRAVLEVVARNLGLALEHNLSLAELAQRTRELERSNTELQQFAYVVSHDLQEPLRSIGSFAQLLIARALEHRPGERLADSPGTDRLGADRLGTGSPDADARAEQLRTYGRYITESGARMTELLADLLAFSRVTSHSQPHRPVNTRLLLAQVQQDLRAATESSGATLEIGELPWVQGDPTQLRQLFQNLIGNSLKFRHPERPPVVRVRAGPPPQAGHTSQTRTVTFEVSDNGIGIEEGFYERIFVIFQRLHSRRSYEGSGIGLSIAQKVAQRHGGSLSVSSVPGEGATFSFSLPLAEPPGKESGPSVVE